VDRNPETRRPKSPEMPKMKVSKTRKSGRDELKGEINKIKPPTFDGEHKKEEDVEIWLLGIKKYFQL
jgi:hypothetical protein